MMGKEPPNHKDPAFEEMYWFIELEIPFIDYEKAFDIPLHWYYSRLDINRYIDFERNKQA